MLFLNAVTNETTHQITCFKLLVISLMIANVLPRGILESIKLHADQSFGETARCHTTCTCTCTGALELLSNIAP